MHLLMVDGIELFDVDGFSAGVDDGVRLVFGVALAAWGWRLGG